MKSKSTHLTKSSVTTTAKESPKKLVEEYRKKYGAALRKAKITIEEIIEWKNQGRR